MAENNETAIGADETNHGAIGESLDTGRRQWWIWRNRREVGCFLLMMAAIQLIAGPKLRLSQWEADANSNAAIAEALAWLHGHVDIPPVVNHELAWDYPDDVDVADPANRLHDTAAYKGKTYNVFPPMMAFLTILVYPLHQWLQVPQGMWLTSPMVLLLFWPLPIVGYVVFRRRVEDPAWAAFLTLAWMCGTAVLPNLNEVRTGYLGQINHVISQVGLLIFAADMLGRRRIWPSLIGLAISTYTRQITFLYGIVVLWVAWRQGGFKWAAACVVGLGVVASPLLTLNALKFGNPIDFGYRHIYVGLEDGYMGHRCVTYGTFSPHFIPDNFYYMHIAPPDIVSVSLTHVNIRESNQNGISLWITTPLAFWVLIAWRRWWKNPKSRILMLGGLPVIMGLLCYHSPGYMEHGYNRFALDYLPIWLLVIAPSTRGGWRTWFSLACVAWSLLYFQSIVPDAARPRRLLQADERRPGLVFADASQQGERSPRAANVTDGSRPMGGSANAG